MARSVAYVTIGAIQAFDGTSDDAPPEDGPPATGLFLNVTYATVSPSNKAGICGGVVVPFNYGDQWVEICQAIQSVVSDAVEKQTKTAPKVCIIGKEPES